MLREEVLNFKNFWAESPVRPYYIILLWYYIYLIILSKPDDDATSERLLDLICAAKLNKYLLEIEPRALSDLLVLRSHRSIIDVQFQP